MKYLLDTSICIHVINVRPPHVLVRFRQEQVGDLGISSITSAELAYSVEKSGSERNRQALQKILSPLEILPFDRDAFWQYGRLRASLERGGQPIGLLDTLIAAQALALDLILVTNNTREFARVPGLRLANWADEALRYRLILETAVARRPDRSPPSPQPSPEGEGVIFPLSRWERVRVRGRAKPGLARRQFCCFQLRFFG